MKPWRVPYLCLVLICSQSTIRGKYLPQQYQNILSKLGEKQNTAKISHPENAENNIVGHAYKARLSVYIFNGRCKRTTAMPRRQQLSLRWKVLSRTLLQWRSHPLPCRRSWGSSCPPSASWTPSCPRRRYTRWSCYRTVSALWWPVQTDMKGHRWSDDRYSTEWREQEPRAWFCSLLMPKLPAKLTNLSCFFLFLCPHSEAKIVWLPALWFFFIISCKTGLSEKCCNRFVQYNSSLV